MISSNTDKSLVSACASAAASSSRAMSRSSCFRAESRSIMRSAPCKNPDREVSPTLGPDVSGRNLNTSDEVCADTPDGRMFDHGRRTLKALPAIIVLLLFPATASADTNQRLRARVLRDEPRLAGQLAQGRTIPAARTLVRWSALHLAWATGASGANFDTMPHTAGDLYYRWFRTRRGGVYCGGAADFTAKTLRLFGIPAFTIDFGDTRGYLTHVTVIVPAGRRYFLMDPTFGIELRRHGRPVTVLDALAHPARVRAQQTVDLTGRTLLTRPGRDGRFRATTCGRDPEDGGCSLASWAANSRPALRRYGYPARPLPALLMLLVRPGAFPDELVDTAPPVFRARYDRLKEGSA